MAKSVKWVYAFEEVSQAEARENGVQWTCRNETQLRSTVDQNLPYWGPDGGS